MIVSVDSSQIHALEQKVETLAAWLTAAAIQAGGLHLSAVDIAVAVQGMVRQEGDGQGGVRFVVMSATSPAENNGNLRHHEDTPGAESDLWTDFNASSTETSDPILPPATGSPSGDQTHG